MSKSTRKRDPEDPPIIMRVALGPKLEPATPFDQERLAAYGLGREVEVHVWQARSAPHLRLYWACLQSTIRNSDHWPNVKELHKAIKLALGYVNRFRGLDGKEYVEPASIAIDKLDQAEFRRFFEDAIALICRDVFGGMDPDTFIDAAKSEIGMNRRAAA